MPRKTARPTRNAETVIRRSGSAAGMGAGGRDVTVAERLGRLRGVRFEEAHVAGDPV